MLLFVKHEVHRCDFLQFLVHFYSQVLLIVSFNFNFSSQYVLLAHTSCNTSNIMSYTVILYYRLVFLVLVRLIAIKIFNRIAALVLIGLNLYKAASTIARAFHFLKLFGFPAIEPLTFSTCNAYTN